MLRVKIVSLFLIFCLSFPPAFVYADWVNDWYNNAISSFSGPTSIELSTRNYYGLGSGALRWQTGTIHPISVQLPSVSFGCGGVDIFLGSLGLMDFDHLIRRSKNIMYAAAAFAFKYALAKLNPKAAQILEALQATANFLNQLQLNECQAGKAIAAVALRPFSAEAANEWGTIKNNLGSIFGDSDSWTKMVDSWKQAVSTNNGGSTPISDTDKSRATGGCPAGASIIAEALSNNKSFLEYLGDQGIFPNEKFFIIARSLIGDIKFDTTGLTPIQIIGCSQDKDDIIEAFKKGELRLCKNITSDNKCDCIVDSTNYNASTIENKIKDAITNFYASLKNKSTLDSATSSVISTIYIYPAYDMLKLAYMTGLSYDSFANLGNESKIIQCSAYYYIVGLMANIMYEAKHSIGQIPTILQTSCSKADSKRCTLCTASTITEIENSVDKYIREINNIIYRVLDSKALDEMLASCKKINEIQQDIAVLDNLLKRTSNM